MPDGGIVVRNRRLLHQRLLASKGSQSLVASLEPLLAADHTLVGHPFWLWLAKRIGRRLNRVDPNVMGSDVDLDDPVGTTGPRMLNEALAEWEVAHKPFGPSQASVYVAPPDTFYPLWDAGQKDKFVELCDGSQTATGPFFANDSEILVAGLGPNVLSTCSRLVEEAFEPTVPRGGGSFAAHHWVHTWIDTFRFPDGQRALGDKNESMSGGGGGAARRVPPALSAEARRSLAALDADLGGPVGRGSQREIDMEAAEEEEEAGALPAAARGSIPFVKTRRRPHGARRRRRSAGAG